MASSPELKTNKDSISNTVSQNKSTVNVNDEAEAILAAAPGKTAESLPNIPAPAGDVTAKPSPSGQAGKVRGPYKKTRVEAPGVKPVEQPAPGLPPEAAARSLNGAFETLLILSMGEDAKLEEAERGALDAGLVEYMKVKGYKLPPGIGLLLCYAMVAVSKIQKPKPKERLSALWTAIKIKFSRKKKDYQEKPSIIQPEGAR